MINNNMPKSYFMKGILLENMILKDGNSECFLAADKTEDIWEAPSVTLQGEWEVS